MVAMPRGDINNGVVSLCVPLNHSWFTRKLGAIEYAQASGRIDLHPWEEQFVKDMRERFDHRNDDTDFGLTPWSPTRKQWNMLSEIFERIDE
jgi:hypothetical protein